MVRLHHQQIQAIEKRRQRLGDVTGIEHDAQSRAARAIGQHQCAAIAGIVRQRCVFDGESAQHLITARGKGLDVGGSSTGHERQGREGGSRCVHAPRPPVAGRRCPARVIHMLMREQDCPHVARTPLHRLEALGQGTHAETGVHQHGAIAAIHQDRVASAPGAEHGHGNHVWPVTRAASGYRRSRRHAHGATSCGPMRT